MAGHSHWKNIKRQKAVIDAKRGKVWSKIARKIIIAAKRGGDPKENLTLRYVIDEGRAANMPKETIQNAIKKGTGELGADNYVEANYEGYGPGGVAVLVETLTNNKTRTAPEIRQIFEAHGGNLGAMGSVAFQFAKQGILTVRSDAATEDQLLEIALDAGAEDVRNVGEAFEITTSPTVYLKVKEALEAAKVPIESADIAHLPKTTVAVNAELGAELLELIDELEDNDDVQTVSHNAELPDDL
jgi:YebC/PmpR family DNA-binding regulatory protein